MRRLYQLSLFAFTVLILIIFSGNQILSQQTSSHDKKSDLKTRAFDRLSWEDASKKGRALDSAMQSSVDQVQQSKYLLFPELEHWGWSNEELPISETVAGESGLAPFGESLGVLYKNSIFIKSRHAYNKEVDGVKYESTEGEYDNVYNIPGGAIIVDHAQSPSHMAYLDDQDCDGDDEERTIRNLVPLKTWSDVTFLEWQQLCAKSEASVKSLKYIIQSNIENVPTESILRQALGEKLKDINWEKYRNGKTFNRTHKEFMAILGTSNASGAGWMLIQHKRQLGTKRITSIEVIGEQLKNEYVDRWVPGLVMKIEDIA